MTIGHARATPAPVAGSPDTNGGDGEDRGLTGEPQSGAHPRRRRRVLVGVGALGVVAAAAAAAVVVAGGDGGGTGGEGAVATTTVPVEVRDLVISDLFDGQLSFGEADLVAAGRDGVVTGVSAVGATVGQGGVLFHLDLQPTVLLHGAVPAFRDLSVDADPGADVTQLEQALVDLGYGDGVTVDTEFTATTAAAVTAWETALGRTDPDGVVTRGDVVFAPGDVRVSTVTAGTGTQVQSGGEVLQATATAKVVSLQLTVSEVADVEAGTPVTVRLPDDTEAAGTISAVATEPSTTGTGSGGEGEGQGEGGGEGEGEGDGETYSVTVAFDDPAVAAGFDSGTVEVTVERSRVEDATAVPVTALLAQSQGGYALQVVDDSQPGGYRLVPVEVGAIAGEWVEVDGEGVEAGVEVVVPE